MAVMQVPVHGELVPVMFAPSAAYQEQLSELRDRLLADPNEPGDAELQQAFYVASVATGLDPAVAMASAFSFDHIDVFGGGTGPDRGEDFIALVYHLPVELQAELDDGTFVKHVGLLLYKDEVVEELRAA
jgi:hypothetical protein